MRKKAVGIRIHKSIGYGLKDLDPDIYSDPRLKYDGENIYESDFADYRKLLEDKAACIEILVSVFGEDPKQASFSWFNIELALKAFKRGKKNPRPSDFMDYDTEDSKFVLFYPIGNVGGDFSSWKRYDDSIDYYENRVYNREMDTIIVDLSDHGACGLYPYDHGMLLKPGRENKTNFGKDRMDSGWYNQLVGHWDNKIDPLVKDEAILKHLKEDWGPGIPASIKLFTLYFGVFKDPMTVYDLRPLLCQWWR